jgi:protein-L-isoaspartate(D-aspartate) O-methyltransferase
MTRTNEQLIRELVRLGAIESPRVKDAFGHVLREHFVSEEFVSQAYENKPLPIGHEQTTSQPLVVAFMLELLDVRPGDTVLEIGSGSGWQSVLLAFLAEKVVSVERIPELSLFAREHAHKHYPELSKKIFFAEGDGSKKLALSGVDEPLSFDRIIAAAATEEVPAVWKEQVKIGGKLVLPVGENIVLLEKTGKQEFIQKEFFGFQFVPLVRD